MFLSDLNKLNFLIKSLYLLHIEINNPIKKIIFLSSLTPNTICWRIALLQ